MMILIIEMTLKMIMEVILSGLAIQLHTTTDHIDNSYDDSDDDDDNDDNDDKTSKALLSNFNSEP